MNLTLDYLKSNRKWLVPNILVWGNSDAFRARFIMTEDGQSKRVVFGSNVIGGENQTIDFADLTDSRGNSLPSRINSPVVVVIPRNQTRCYLVGRPSDTGFKIARTESDDKFQEDGLVDLLIMEVDLP